MRPETHRSREHLLRLVLENCSDEGKSKSNLEHQIATEHTTLDSILESATSLGLIESSKIGKRFYIKTTKKGIEYLKRYKSAEELLTKEV